MNYFFTLDKGILKYNNIDTTSSLYKQVYLTIFMICPFYLSSCLGPGGCKNIAIHTCHTAFLRNSTLLLGTDGQWFFASNWMILRRVLDIFTKHCRPCHFTRTVYMYLHLCFLHNKHQIFNIVFLFLAQIGKTTVFNPLKNLHLG